jgi:enoyl-[acyl-carrier protein] reductase III
MVATTLGLDGRVALVTGATRGLGLAIARKLCACGSEVFLNYARSDDDAREAALALSGLKGSATPVKGDVTRPEVLAAILEEIRQRHGRLDIFVHSVAPWHPMPALGAAADVVNADMAAVVGPLLRAAPVLAELMAGGPGRIIAVSSMGAGRVVPGYVSLGMSKAALESLVRYLAAELADRRITVNAVSTAKLDKDRGQAPPHPMMAALAARTPGGRLTSPDDVAAVVALLCADEAAWVQGQVVSIDGGFGICV